MKNLLDFFEEDMLYRAESAPTRRFDRSMVQSAKGTKLTWATSSTRPPSSDKAEARFRNHPTDEASKDMSLELIRTKIAELETKIADLRTTERELLALGTAPAARAKVAPPEPRKRGRPAMKTKPTGPRKTIGAAIAEVLGLHGPLEVAEIADRIQSTGRDINRRTVSYSLQAMKKQGLVKAGDGKWGLSKARATAARA